MFNVERLQGEQPSIGRTMAKNFKILKGERVVTGFAMFQDSRVLSNL